MMRPDLRRIYETVFFSPGLMFHIPFSTEEQGHLNDFLLRYPSFLSVSADIKTGSYIHLVTEFLGKYPIFYWSYPIGTPTGSSGREVCHQVVRDMKAQKVPSENLCIMLSQTPEGIRTLGTLLMTCMHTKFGADEQGIAYTQVRGGMQIYTPPRPGEQMLCFFLGLRAFEIDCAQAPTHAYAS